MWYECLPSMFIVGAAIVSPQYIVYFLNSYATGNPMRRFLATDWDNFMFRRDAKLSTAVWDTMSLENIPDK